MGADRALLTALPETRLATARKEQRQSQSSSNPEPKGCSMHCYRLSPG